VNTFIHIYTFVTRKAQKEEYHMTDLDVYGSEILKWILSKWDVSMWTGLIWLRIGSSGGLS
jgi:hypothetical protein